MKQGPNSAPVYFSPINKCMLFGLNVWLPLFIRVLGGGINYPPSNLTDWPDATNTGVPAGTNLALHSGDYTTSSNGELIDALDITGTIFVNHSNVTIQRCKITSNGVWGINTSANGVSGIIIRDCEIDLNDTGSYGIFGHDIDVRRCNIHNIEDGIACSAGDNIYARDNYIHTFTGPDGAHNDGIVNDGGCNNVTIVHNRIINAAGQTSCVTIDNYFGSTTNVEIRDNWLSGGTYPIYVEEMTANPGTVTNVTVENNLLDAGTFGYYSIRGEKGNMPIVSNNRTTWGWYLDGDIPPVEGTVIFAPSNTTDSTDANINTGFRVAATLSNAVLTQVRIVIKASNAGLLLNSVWFGKRSSGQVATGTLKQVSYGSSTTSRQITSGYLVSDWMSPEDLSFALNDVMLVGFATGNPGGTFMSGTNTNATSYFGSTANVSNANPSYSNSANNCFGLVRIETK